MTSFNITAILLSLLLTSCGAVTSKPISTPTSIVPGLTPTLTQIATPSPSPTLIPTSTPIPLGGGGNLIAFVSNRNGNTDIYEVDVNTYVESRLTSGPEDKSWPMWSPDGKVIAYALRAGYNNEIYTMFANGTNQKRLTQSQLNGDYPPIWSPDGKHISFFSVRDGSWSLYKMNADGTSQTRLTGNTVFESFPSWSPDGGKIAYTFWRATVYQPDIYTINADGSNTTQLTQNDASDINPAWSPDGQWIAFTSYRDAHAEVYIMKPDGSDQTRLTDSTGGNSNPIWSPDGKYIAFISWRDEPNTSTCGNNCNEEIYVMDADGSHQTRLTNSPGIDDHPVWSPDGKYIAFVSFRNENERDTCGDHCNSDIYLMNSNGSNQIQLTNDPNADWWPTWQPQ